jgi:hypothetical protein
MATPTRCPICGKPAADKTRPFCSSRCADIDLGRWFSEAYRAPGAPLSDSDTLPMPDDET